MAIMLVYRMGAKVCQRKQERLSFCKFFFIMIFAGNHHFFNRYFYIINLLYLKVPLMTVAQQSVKGLNSFSDGCPIFILIRAIMSAGGITDRPLTWQMH